MPCERMHAEYATYDPELNDPLAVGEPPEFPHPAMTRTVAATVSMPHERSGRRVWTSIIGNASREGKTGHRAATKVSALAIRGAEPRRLGGLPSSLPSGPRRLGSSGLTSSR